MRVSVVTVILSLVSLLLLPLSGAAGQDGAKPLPVVLYIGTIEDGAYNELVHQGVELFRSSTGQTCEERQAVGRNDAYDAMVRTLARAGFSPIIIPYNTAASSIPELALAFPTTRFVVLGGTYDLPNIYSFSFDVHEGAFLAGALAAMNTHSGLLGFIGGENSLTVNRILCGFKQGARYVDTGTHVIEAFIGHDESAWHNGTAGAELAREQIAGGADIIFAAAGESGIAVLHEVAAAGGLGIGMARNQNGLEPGHVLTSVMKRVDKAVFAALMVTYRRGGWQENRKRLGLSQQAVSLAFDRFNAALVSEEDRHRIDELVESIQLGNIRVHDYADNNYCPVW